MLRVTWAQAAGWRARRQYLDRRVPANRRLAVASRLCGLHAQLMSSAELQLWARVDGLKPQALPRALWEQRTLVKTWAMRGTLHLLPSAELPLWYAGLSTSRRYLREAAWINYYGITLAELDQLTVAIGEALDGRVMTREELVEAIARLTSAGFAKKLAANSWGTMLKPAAFTGRLCFGPSVGQRVQFARPDTWLGRAGQRLGASVDPSDATTAIARRFLEGFGPATDHDLSRWWNGGGVSTIRKWTAQLGHEVCSVDLEGRPAWMLAKHVRELRSSELERSVRLLPAFDQYVIGASHHAAHLLPGDLRARVYRPQGWISPVLLVNGRMEGVWRHEPKGSRLQVTVEPFRKQPAWVRRGATEEAERLAAFRGGALEFSWKG